MKNDFESKWNSRFLNKVPIPYLFKYYFPDSWLRLHSFADSKRYADNSTQMNILLKHQNNVIDECLNSGSPIFIVSGNSFIGDSKIPIYDQVSMLNYDFAAVPSINLHKIDPEHFDDGEDNDLYFTPMFTETLWEPNIHNDLLVKIANDETRAFFISFEKNVIIAPYDGGLDLIIEDCCLKNEIKKKYSELLSKRDDGL